MNDRMKNEDIKEDKGS